MEVSRRIIQELCDKTCTQRRQWLSWRANKSQNPSIKIARRKARRLRSREHDAAGFDAPGARAERRALRRDLHRHRIRQFRALVARTLAAALASLAEWDRATRSMWDGLQIVKEAAYAEHNISSACNASACRRSSVSKPSMN